MSMIQSTQLQNVIPCSPRFITHICCVSLVRDTNPDSTFKHCLHYLLTYLYSLGDRTSEAPYYIKNWHFL